MPSPAFDMAEYNSPEFTRYAAAHENLNGPGDARPTAIQIIKDDDLEGSSPRHQHLELRLNKKQAS
jgi:hypothetical protein